MIRRETPAITHVRLRRTAGNLAALLLAGCGLLATPQLFAADPLRVVPDNVSYNVGDAVKLRFVFPNSELLASLPLDFSVVIRYAGEKEPVASREGKIRKVIASTVPPSTEYEEIWKIPVEARTGRYEVDLKLHDPESRRFDLNLSGATSFAVYRKLVRIDRIDLDKTFYTSGDAVTCRASLKNLTEEPVSGLVVEFADRHWPWIAPPAGTELPRIVSLAEKLTLSPGAAVEVKFENSLAAQQVKEPTIQQFAVVVWDADRKNVYDIAFTELALVNPPGVDSPKPYPPQYIFPKLSMVNTSSYRDFNLPSLNSAAIQFNRAHTMFPAEGEAAVQFSVRNPTDETWPGVSIHASLRSLGSAGFGEKTVAESADLEPRASALEKEVAFALPADGGGLFRVMVQVKDKSGKILAESGLEIASNPLPKSVLIFCAHEDDEMAHGGIIRAAVENRLPLELVYFTSGDAGSCDRYYEHSCSPAEALNFGALRMDEARAALAHLGVSREHIHFLGLPDGGSEQIWKYHIEPSQPYRSVLLATDHAPYEGLARPNLPYARKSAVEAAKEFIRKFQPEVIYTGHPDERHVDHRTNNWFVVKALQELLRERAISPDIKLLVDQVYGAREEARAPYKYEQHVLNVSGEARARWQEAVWFYQSQFGNRALGNLRTFSKLPRTEVHQQVLDWKEHEGWNEKD